MAAEAQRNTSLAIPLASAKAKCREHRGRSDVLPFHDILDAEMANSALASTGVTFKERIYTPFVTLSMFLSQVLDRMALGFPLSRLHQAFARVLARFHKKLLWFRSALVGARFDAARRSPTSCRAIALSISFTRWSRSLGVACRSASRKAFIV